MAATFDRHLLSASATQDPATFLLGLIDHGVFFLGAHMKILRLNSAAAALVTDGDGLAVRDGQLTTSDALSLKLLTRAVGEACGAEKLASTIALKRSAPRRPLITRLLPYREASDIDVILVAADPDAELGDSLLDAARAFGLTRTEATLVARFIAARDLNAAALSLGMQPSTARSHLKRAMHKTDTNKQSDLVRVLLASRLPVRG